MSNPYLLPYQAQWLADTSRIKIWEKSRRIGATFVQGYEDTEYCALAKKQRKVYFSSADESAAKEYIDYIRFWSEKLNFAVTDIYEDFIDTERDITALTAVFKNQSKIFAMTSNPKRFRSKGGKIILDEFAFNNDQAALWGAAKPCITWGYPVRILSTYNGMSNKYYHFVEDIKRGKLNWSLHTTPITVAVEQGLADKIMERELTPEERQAWIDQERADCADEDIWLQEYMCTPVDSAGAFLSYDLIRACEADDILVSYQDIKDRTARFPGGLYAGVDIGRKKDLTVVTAIEKTGAGYTTRFYKELYQATFEEQKILLWGLYSHPDFRRVCHDATGLGMQIAEEAVHDFGKFRVEPITFTATVKEQLAYGLYRKLEDRRITIPRDDSIREDLHSIRKLVTSSGNIRFDVGKSDANGHADRFWSIALAVEATDKDTNSPPIPVSKRRRKSAKAHRGYKTTPGT
jgi:phage FluMu gp28-like protein